MTTPKEFVLKEVSFVWSQFQGGGGVLQLTKLIAMGFTLIIPVKLVLKYKKNV